MTLFSWAFRVARMVAGIGILESALVAQHTNLPEYKATQKVSGTIRVCGSPQMGGLLKFYEEGFAKLQPSVHFADELESTLTAVAGVYSGRSEIGLLGREIWPAEARKFQLMKGHAPTVIDVATGSYDVPKATFALMVFVPRFNPIASLSKGQLERIFASNSRPISKWGNLGLRGDWASRPIHLYGFNVDNDKSQIFTQLVFSKGERWNTALKEFSNGPAAAGADAGELILRAVARDPNAIGISNVHYATEEVKALAISTPQHHVPIAPTRESVGNRSYPLTRAIYMVVDRDAPNPTSAALREFLKYVLSRQGQQAVIEEGNYLPLTAEVARIQFRKLPTH